MNSLFKKFSIKFITLVLMASLPFSIYFVYNNLNSSLQESTTQVKSELQRNIELLKGIKKNDNFNETKVVNSMIKELNLNYSKSFHFDSQQDTQKELIYKTKFELDSEVFNIGIYKLNNDLFYKVTSSVLQISLVVVICSILALGLILLLLVRPILEQINAVDNKVDQLFFNDDNFESLEINEQFKKNLFAKSLNRILQKVKMDIFKVKSRVKDEDFVKVNSVRADKAFENKNFILSISNIFYLIKLNPHTHPEILMLAQKGVDFTNHYIQVEEKQS